MTRRRSFLLLVAAAQAIELFVAAVPSAEAIAEGQKLAAELRALAPTENLEVAGFMKIRDGEGRRTRIPFRYQIVVGQDRWQSVYETRPTNATPEKLVVERAGGQPNRYTQARPASAGAGEPVSVAGDQAMIPFAGSDFWLADLGLEFLHWPRQRIVEETKIRMRKGRPCRVLESINDRPQATGYTRVRSWIDTKTGGVILAEAYGPDGTLMKEFEIGGLTKVNGHWELKNMEMRDAKKDSVTVFEFKYERRE